MIELTFAQAHPDLAKRAYGWDTHQVIGIGNKKLMWQCAADPEHIYDMRVSHVIKGIGCPYCSGNRVLVGNNDLATKYPDLAKEADGWDPTTVYPTTHKKLAWKCSTNPAHRWEAVGFKRVSGQGCPYCSGNRVDTGRNDLATMFPDIAAEAVGWDPTKVSAYSHSKLEWQCPLFAIHRYEASVGNRTNLGRRCPYCSGRKVLVGWNDLATVMPELAAEAVGWDPTKVTAHSNKRLPWKCSFDQTHRWDASLNQRSYGSGCPYCSGRRPIVGVNDLATTNPELLSMIVEGDPTSVSAGNDARFLWRCPDFHEHQWRTTVRNVAVLHSGCPSCAIYGFDPTKEGWLYLLRHTKEGLLKIGITNYLDQRLMQHERTGFEVIDSLGPIDGVVVKSYEQKILKLVRAGGAQKAPERMGTFSGYTEAWVAKSYPATNIAELLARLS